VWQRAFVAFSNGKPDFSFLKCSIIRREFVMLVDHRTYTLRVGTLRKQLALYEKHGFAIQKRHFGEPLAWLVSETGDVNTYVHIWVYEDAADRTRKREALFKDPEWLKYIEMNAEAGYLIKQESKLMSPAPFAPIRR